MKKGTRLIFYVTGTRRHSKCFVAEANVAGPLGRFSSFDISRYTDEKEWADGETPVYRIELKGVKRFKSPVNIYDIKDKMDLFSKNKTNKWGTRIQGGAFRITKRDYNLIKKKAR